MSNSTRNIRYLAILFFVSSIAADDPPKKPASPSSKPAAKSTAKPAAKPATKPKSGKAAVNSMVPTEKECAAYGKALVAAINQNDREAIHRLMDWEQTTKRASEVANIPQKIRDEFIAETKFDLENSTNVLTGFAATIEKGARFRYLRTVRKENDRLAQFRYLLNGVSYISILLQKKVDGAVVGIDFVPMNTGEYFSKDLRPFYLSIAVKQNGGQIAGLTGADRELADNLDKVAAMNQLIIDGKGADALEIYDSLPAKVQNLKLIQTSRIAAAARASDDKIYAAVVENFRDKFPADSTCDFLSIDYYLLHKNYDEAAAAIDRAAAQVGGDAYFGVMKTNVLLGKGDFPAARKVITAARKKEPSLIETHWSSVDVALLEEDFATVARLLDGIADRFHINVSDVSTKSEFRRFFASPEGKAWQKSYAKGKSATAAKSDAKDK